MPILADSVSCIFFATSEENCIYNKQFSFFHYNIQSSSKKTVFRDTDNSGHLSLKTIVKIQQL